MSYINLRGHPTWSVQYPNVGEPLLLLHGGLSATENFDSYILPAVADRFHVYGYDRSAHGRTGMREGYYHFDFQRDEAIAYIEDVIGAPAHLLGHSDGGIITLLVASPSSTNDVAESTNSLLYNVWAPCSLTNVSVPAGNVIVPVPPLVTI